MTLAEFKAWFDERVKQIRSMEFYMPNKKVDAFYYYDKLVAECKEKLATVKEPVYLPARLHDFDEPCPQEFNETFKENFKEIILK